MNELRECPLCGGKAVQGKSWKVYFVQCTECNILFERISHNGEDLSDKVRDMWNNRRIPQGEKNDEI